jgi:GWxTD domain-containing protein
MKKFTLFTFILLLMSAAFAQKLSVMVDYKSYNSPAEKPYLEITSLVNGKSVVYAQTSEGKFEAEVRITFKAFVEDSLVNVFDYILISEFFEDADPGTKPDFGDIQNMQLPNGKYILHISVQDINAAFKPAVFADIVEINFPKDEVTISDITLYQSVSRDLQGNIFDKYGFSLLPLYYGFVPESIYSLPFSCEIYNTDKFAENEMITIKSYITSFENNLMPYPEARCTFQTKAKPVVVAMGEIGIFKLPSGNYNLITEVFDKESILLASCSYFFQRSNPGIVLNLEDIAAINITNTFVDNIKDTMQLLEFVRFLYPISTPIEKDFYQTKMKNIPVEQLKRFFYAFWIKRDAKNPEKAWLEYYEKVKHADREFGCKLVQGYRTDRGRVYLQYGPPNSIFESPYDSHSYPYEIWHYYYCVDQSNVKFVFYNTDLVSNDYELLHSDKRGEMQDPFWKMKVTLRKFPNFNPDETEPGDMYGGNPKYDWFYHR